MEDKKNVRQFGLPKPHWMNFQALMTLLSSVSISKFSRFRYAEPSIHESGKISWLIEYSCTINSTRSDIVHILREFKETFQSKFKCSVLSISYNFKDRISLKVINNNNNNQLDVSIKPKYSEKSTAEGSGNFHPKRGGLGFVPSTLKTLEQEQGSQKIMTNPMSTKDSQSGTKSRRSVNSKKLATERYIQAKLQRCSKVEVREEVPLPTSHDQENRNIRIEDTSSTLPPQNTLNESKDNEPRTAVTRLTLASPTYAKYRLNDSRIYSMVRLYIAYLGHQDVSVNFEGETKASLGMKIKSEGLPLGKELTTLWYQFGRSRELSDIEISTDLESYESYCKTSRVMRLQRATVLTRQWLGLKGGSILPQTPLEFSELQKVTGIGNRHNNVINVKLDNVDICRFS